MSNVDMFFSLSFSQSLESLMQGQSYKAGLQPSKAHHFHSHIICLAGDADHWLGFHSLSTA